MNPERAKEIAGRIADAYEYADELGVVDRLASWWQLRKPIREARRARRRARRAARKNR